jgi:N-acetylmuramoyl-L-alanine amidase
MTDSGAAPPSGVVPAVPSWVSLDSLTNRFGVVSVTEEKGVTTWQLPDATVRFFDDSRRLEFNGTLLWMNGATTTNAVTNVLLQATGTNTAKTVFVRTLSQTDLDTVLVPLLAPPGQADPAAPSGPFIVILDPGHGGDDPGAVVADMPHEKTLVLDVARRVRRRLKAAGIEVRMTRGTDKTLTLAERPDFARRRKGSVFVSIHANKATSTTARGIETFVMPAAGFPSTAETVPVAEAFPGNRHDAASLQLAYFLQRELIEQTQSVDRGVKRARFEVLRLAPCPAALVEIGFLSNASERNRLASVEYRDHLADGIAHGIRLFMLQNARPPL